MGEPAIDDGEKLKGYGFEEVGKYRLLGEDTIITENRKKGCKTVVYAITVDGRVKYIGSTTRGQKRGSRLKQGENKITDSSSKESKNILQELMGGKTIRLFYLTPLPTYNYMELSFETAYIPPY